MSSRSLNKVMLIGNLTRDPELRYTPQGTPVVTMGLATNRSWTDSSGQKQEETEFHRVVAWNKLAELCSQLLFKGRKIYVEGRLQTRKWTAQDGQERQTTEVVIDDMIVLDSRRREEGEMEAETNVAAHTPVAEETVMEESATEEVKPAAKGAANTENDKEEVKADDIPF
jgi:single-strand DNA-binding protein